MYFLVLRRFFFFFFFFLRRDSFNPRVRASQPPGRNDRTTLPTTNRNPNIFPSLRFSLPLAQFLLLATAASFYPKPFFPRLQQWRGLPRWRKASTCVRALDRHGALWNHPDRQITAKPLTNMSKQTNWPWLESNSYRLDSGLQLVVLAHALTIWASRPQYTVFVSVVSITHSCKACKPNII